MSLAHSIPTIHDIAAAAGEKRERGVPVCADGYYHCRMNRAAADGLRADPALDLLLRGRQEEPDLSHIRDPRCREPAFAVVCGVALFVDDGLTDEVKP